MQALKNKKGIFLAYDTGFSQGPFDLTEEMADPNFVVDFVLKEKFDGICVTPGMFLNINSLLKKKLSIIVKINGITSLSSKEKLDIHASILAPLNEILKNDNIDAIGFNLYLGSKYESLMLRELGEIIFKAKEHLKKVIVWPVVFSSSNYERHNDTLRNAYGVRAAFEMGADAAVLPWPETRRHFDIIARMSPNFPLFLSENTFEKFKKDEEILNIIKDFFAEGGKGIFLSPKIVELFGGSEFTKKIQKTFKH